MTNIQQLFKQFGRLILEKNFREAHKYGRLILSELQKSKKERQLSFEETQIEQHVNSKIAIFEKYKTNSTVGRKTIKNKGTSFRGQRIRVKRTKCYSPRTISSPLKCAGKHLQKKGLTIDRSGQTNISRSSKKQKSRYSRFISNQEVSGGVYPVWFGTNRKVNESKNGFTSERCDVVTYGKVDVYIPEGHRFGETGASFWMKLKRGDFTDDSLKLKKMLIRAHEVFYNELKSEMEKVHASGRLPHAVVFLHGYNTSFEESAIRAAQIGFDLKIDGAIAFFSWPSQGTKISYTADEATIEASEQAITNFLVDFTRNCGADKIHIIAHSMGNRGLIRVLQRIAANAEIRSEIKFGQIFLAAPDIDRDLFKNLAHLYPQYSERTTLYASNKDHAVHISAMLHAAPRAGYFPPYTVVPGIDTITVPEFDVDVLGHSYFAKAEALLYDIYSLLRLDNSPDHRQRIKSVEYEGEKIWSFFQ